MRAQQRRDYGREINTETKTFISSVKATNSYITKNTYMMVWSLKKIFTGKVPMKSVQGIVGITKIGSDIIENQGIMLGILLTAIISLNLAILNLL